MASAPLLAVLATRALHTAKTAAAEEPRIPRGRETAVVRADPAPRRALHARGLHRLRRRLLAHLSTTAHPRS